MQLRPYQEQGVERLLALTARHSGALLADEPGLGKTAQAIGFINRELPGSVLIVCPASLRINWKRELDLWLDKEGREYWYGSLSIDIRSYEEIVARPNQFSKPYDLIIFDEAHYLKNPAAKRTKACLALTAGKRLFLTGTPVVNRPMDLYPILASLGAKLSRFEYGKRYCAGHLVRVPRRGGARMVWDFSGASHTDELNATLRKHVMVRRTKAEVLTELPRKVRQIIELDIPDGETAELKAAVSRMFDGMEQAAANLAELKRIAFTELAAARLAIARAKLPAVLDAISRLLEEEDQIVVFAYHREIIEAIADAVPGAVKLYGGLTDAAKDGAVQTFQAGRSPLFVGQITAAGTGITLTAARTVLFAELDWVPGNVTQAEDRCHRIGQKDTVRVIHLAAKDSVDARMIHALVNKQQVIEEVTQ